MNGICRNRSKRHSRHSSTLKLLIAEGSGPHSSATLPALNMILTAPCSTITTRRLLSVLPPARKALNRIVTSNRLRAWNRSLQAAGERGGFQRTSHRKACSTNCFASFSMQLP